MNSSWALTTPTPMLSRESTRAAAAVLATNSPVAQRPAVTRGFWMIQWCLVLIR